MPDEPAVTQPALPLAEIGSALAPIIYFDSAPNFGVNNGVPNIALEAVTAIHVGTEIRIERRVVAHLRMSLTAFASLKVAVDGLELAIKPTETSSVN
jgi:hypothetical protein